MTISVLVNGAFGRMGQLATQALEADPRFVLVGQIGRGYDLKQSILDSQAQVVVDLTHPSSVFSNTQTIIEAGAHPVIGTSGLLPAEIKQLTAKCAAAQLGGIIAPNFSLGALLMMKYAQAIVQYLPQVEIIEMHHDTKLDSPSGTALYTANLLADAAETTKQADHLQRQETIPHARGANHRGIPIHALRLPGFLARQQIIFGNTGETLMLQHDSIDRQCFMPGLCLACEKVVGLKELVNGLEKLL